VRNARGIQIFLHFTQFFWNKTQNPTFSCKFLMFLADIFLIIRSSEKISYFDFIKLY